LARNRWVEQTIEGTFYTVISLSNKHLQNEIENKGNSSPKTKKLVLKLELLQTDIDLLRKD